MSHAKRNHYNPCFWTPHWNREYHQRFQDGAAGGMDVRRQRVHALSIKAGQIFTSTVENIHFDKNLGLAEISRVAAEDFARRHHPDKYEDFLRRNPTAPYSVYIDFEQILGALEEMEPYVVLREVIRKQEIGSPNEKAELGCFIFLQLLRCHAVMNSMLQWHEELGLQKFEHFVTLKWFLSDPEALASATVPLIMSHWTLFVMDRSTFPLCDSPILVRPRSIMVALSPTLLLEILRHVPAGEHQWTLDERISEAKLSSFRRRTIGNTFREIIFDRRDLLEDWKRTPAFVKRTALMHNRGAYNRMVAKHGNRELWQVNAYGNQE